MLKPYYERGKVKIYCCNCLEYLQYIDYINSFLFTDPPYGIGMTTENKNRSKECKSKNYKEIIGDDKPFDPKPLLLFKKIVLWGANYYTDSLPPSKGWLIWDKKENLESKRKNGTFSNAAEVEMAWTNLDIQPRIFSHMWMGRLKKTERKETRIHPMQKPIALSLWGLQLLADKKDVIYDLYMGSGSTVKAAYKLGHEVIGIEKSEHYCELAVKSIDKYITENDMYEDFNWKSWLNEQGY